MKIRGKKIKKIPRLINIIRFILDELGKGLSFLPDTFKIKLTKIVPKSNNLFISKLTTRFFMGLLDNYKGNEFVIKEFIGKNYNYKLKIYFNSFIAKQYYFNNYDRKLSHLLKKHLQKDDIFVDIGAAIGQITLMASSFCNNVIAFEPILDSYFKENVKLNNKNIKFFSFALSDHNGKEVINLNENEAKSSFEPHYKPKSCGTKLISIKKFDDLNIKADFVKIRVQEHEYNVLKGMTKSLKDIKYIYCRLSPSNYKQINKLLEEHGFYRENKKTLGNVFYKK